jgi:hypothetical protein
MKNLEGVHFKTQPGFINTHYTQDSVIPTVTGSIEIGHPSP